MAFLYIIFVGHQKKRLLISSRRWMKEYPPEKFILITGQQETTGERKALEIAEEMRKELDTPLYSVIIKRINKLDISDAVSKLTEIIITEKEMGYNTLLNISGSLRIFSVIAYIVACLTQSKLVSVIPKYDAEDNEIGIEKHLEIPILPRYALGEEQLKILMAIGTGVDSVEILVNKLCPECRSNKKKYSNERSRVSYYLELLEKVGFIVRTKEGKNVRTHLTELGRIYSIKNYKRK